MRILFASYAERTQALPMVPLAWATRCAGHEVMVATQPSLVEAMADSGLPVTAVGRELPLYRLWRHAEADGEGDGDTDLVDPALPLTWPAASVGYAELVQWWFRTANEPMVEDLHALCREWRPDLVVWEAVTFAGALAARACGIPHVRFVWSVDVLARMRERVLAARPDGVEDDSLAEWLAAAAARLGTDFSEDLAVGRSTITFLPPSLRGADSRALRYLPMRFVPYAGRALLPDWLREPGPGPRVCLTLGTSALERFGRLVVPAAELVLGVAHTGADVVVTLDDPRRAGLEPHDVPPNVRFAGEVPLDLLLAHCDAVVNHAGPGTVATAIAAGLPQLVVPEEFDAPVLARQLAATGAAVDLPLDEVTTHRVHAAIEALLQEGPARRSARRSARRLQREAAAMPSPRELVRTLEHEMTREAG